jgi:Zn-dependent peptidase ImmA (M78 family)
MQNLVCAHELGHDRLHQHLVKSKSFQEFMLCDMKSRPEFEANVFACELLIPDIDILDLIYSNYDVEQISSFFNIDINLVAIKVATMNTRGYSFNSSFLAKSNFLGK